MIRRDLLAAIAAQSAYLYAELEAAAIAAARANDAALWYIGRDLSGVFGDSYGTTPAVLGGPVGLWRDRQYGVGSGSGFHLSQATAAARPTVVTLASGLLGISFDGNSDYLVSTYRSLYAAGSSTLIYAHDQSLSSTGGGVFMEVAAASTTEFYTTSALPGGQTTVAAAIRNNSNVWLANNVTVLGAGGRTGAGVTTVTDTGSTITGRRNGVASAPVSYARSGSLSTDVLSVCATARTTPGNYVGGRFGLICSAPTAMSASHRAAIERFAAHLVGVAYAG